MDAGCPSAQGSSGRGPQLQAFSGQHCPQLGEGDSVLKGWLGGFPQSLLQGCLHFYLGPEVGMDVLKPLLGGQNVNLARERGAPSAPLNLTRADAELGTNLPLWDGIQQAREIMAVTFTGPPPPPFGPLMDWL